MFNRDMNRTPKQRADKALMNIIARMGGCGFLIYFVVKLLTIPKAESPNQTVTTIIAIAFLVISAVVIFMTVQDLVFNLKNGRFSASTYEDADLADYMERREAGSAGDDVDSAKQELGARGEDAPGPDAGEDDKEE